MKRSILIFFLLLPVLIYAQQTITVSGTVLNADQVPVAGANVVIKGTTTGTQTDFDGKFQLESVPINSILVISYIGNESYEIHIAGGEAINIEVIMDKDSVSLEELVIATVSPVNFWTGAKLGFNIIGNEDENLLVGSASVNILKIKTGNFRSSLGLVGSIGSFSFKEKGIANLDSQVKKLAQSINGLSFGLGYVHGINDSPATQKGVVHRFYGLTGLRYNNFEDVGDDDKTVNFTQWATTIGYEVQWNEFFNKGPLTFSFGTNLYLFNSERYLEVFDEDRGNLVSLEGTIIFPFSPKVGLLANGTFALNNSPVYILGLIFK